MTTTTKTMGPDEQAIHAVHTAWIEAVNAGDLARLLTMLTDDVVLINPGGAPIGREGFRASFTQACATMAFRCVSDLEEVVVAGDVAYTRAKDALTISPRAGGETTRFAGYRVTVYRKQPDGRWLLARDAHTLMPARS
jgi:uncharacterized protein (TIGR02246 family)